MLRTSPQSPRVRSLLPFAVAAAYAFAACGGDGGSGPGDDPPEGVEIGPSGGVAEFVSGQVKLVVPAGALTSAVTLTAEPTSNFPAVAGVIANAVFELGPDGTQFAQPVAVTIGYGTSDIPATSDESELRLYKVVNNTWQLVAGSAVSASGNTVTGSVTSFSRYGVRGLPVETVVVTPASQSVNVGATVSVTAQPKGTGGVNLSRKTVSYESSNTTTATVDNNGVVTGQAAGTATITATSEGVQGTATVTVHDPITSVVVTPATPAINFGQTVQLTATARGFKNNTIPGTPSWVSSNNGIASVNTTGLVTGNGAGSAIITATIGGVSGTSTVAVSIPLTTYQGNWAGTWNNTTFGSSGSATLAVAVNQQLGTMTMVLDLNGTVFGGADPPAMNLTGNVTGGAFTVSGTQNPFGPCSITGNGSAFSGSCGAVTAPGFISVVFSNGTVSPTQIRWEYRVAVLGNDDYARGVVLLNKN